MSFMFGLLDVVLTLILLFDTLGLIYQFRKSSSSINPKEYVRVCFSWILFLVITSLFSCERKGFFGTLIRLIILSAKVFVTIPLFNGTMKIHHHFIEEGKAIDYYNRAVEFVKSKLCKGKCTINQGFPSTVAETIEPENLPQGDTIPGQ